MKTYIGIDNGVSGTIAIIPSEGEPVFCKTPIKREQDYTKAKKTVSRVDILGFKNLLEPYTNDSFLLLERPLVNPGRFTATASALRCHEAELAIIELLGIPFQFIDSREWQKMLLPKGIEGEELKKASLDIGSRLFPQFKEFKHPDRDALLIAEYARRKNL